MRFKEFFQGAHSVSNLGALGFRQNIMRDQVRTPHMEMRSVVEMLMRRPLAMSGVKQIARFVIGNDIKITSEDKKTQEFLTKWMGQRKTLIDEITTMTMLNIATGNGYLEPTFTKRSNGDDIFDNVYAISDPSRVYRYLDATQDSDYWIYRVPLEAMSYRGRSPKFYKVSYVQGSRLFTEMIWAVPVEKGKIWWWKSGWSPEGLYGRGFLASTIDDEEVIQQIIRNYAIMARYRAIGRKIFSIGDPDRPGDQADIDDIKLMLDNVADDEHLIINKPFKSEPLHYTGENDPMDQQLDFLRKEQMSGLVPNYLTPWNAEVNRATAGEVKIGFQLELDFIKQGLIDFLNMHVLESLLKSYPFLQREGTTFATGYIDMDSKESRMQYARELFDNDAITLNEYRVIAGFKALPNGDNFKGELQLQDAKKAIAELPLDQIRPPKKFDALPTQQSFSFQEQYEENDFNKLTGRQYSVLKERDVGGKILRLVQDKQKNFHVFEGIKALKNFEDDEKEIAQFYFDRQIEKLIELQDEFIKDSNENQEDSVDLMFDELKKVYADIIDELFSTVGKSKASQESFKEAILDHRVLNDVDGLFSKFTDKINSIIQKVTGGLLVGITDGSDGLEVDAIQKQRLQQLGKTMFDNKTFAQIKSFNEESKTDIKRILADGIGSGQQISKIKQDLKDKYAGFKTKENPQDSDIDRIVRTSVNSTMNVLKLRKLQDMGFEYFEWLSAEDDKVRPLHVKRNRRVFKISDALNQTGTLQEDSFPGKAINCRCTLIPYK